MPQIKVNEKDLSWYYRQREPGQLTVMMPGVATFGPTYPTLVNQNNFVKYYGSSAVHNDDLSYNMAASFVKTGIDVLFWRVGLYGSSVASSKVYALSKVTLSGPTTADHNFTIDDPSDTTVVPVKFSVKSGTTTFYIPFYDTDLQLTRVRTCILAGLGTTDSGLLGENGITEQVDTKLLVKSKWVGSFGNSITVNVKGSGDTKYFTVYSNGVLVEQLIYNFVNPSDPYYYQVVNQDTSYIEVVIDDGFNSDNFKTYVLQDSVALVNGKDYLTNAAGKFIYNSNNDVVDTFSELVVKAIEKEMTLGEESVFEQLKDNLTYDFDVAISSGYNNIGSSYNQVSTIDDAFIDLVEKRGDAIYLVDGTENMKYDDLYVYTGLPAPTDVASFSGKSYSGFNTSYAACIGPWSTAQFVSNGNNRILPGSYVFLVSWGQSLSNGNSKWLAPAGVKRASVGSFVKSTVYPVGSAILDVWQNQDTVSDNMFRHKINPIVNLKRYGYVIYGNSTLLQDRYDGSTSMLNSLSIRIVSNMIKTHARDVALQLQFDQIDDDLFAQFKSLMTVFMDQLKYNGALYDYAVIVDRSELTLDDLNNRTVPVRIMISPNPAAENFIINLEISQAGVTFGDESNGNQTLAEA